ncbi:MAG TPA: GGDEF domain-containing protein [Actinomycetales bacterium]|nr:GGDEF domain-containing protein [Actinomycetales bacterium]
MKGPGMVDDRQLSAVLSEFAYTIATDFSIASILDHLVRQIVHVVPVTSAGVTLIEEDGHPHLVAASNDAALRFERLQTELSDGPCVLAHGSGAAVSVADLSVEERFPRFATAASQAGLGSVFAFPLNHGRVRLGALDLYNESVGSLSADAMSAAQTLANVATAYLLNARTREEAHQSSDQMRHLASHDALTGLPNRMLLLQRIDHAAERARRSHAPAAVLFVDLDRFKSINDTYGHDMGDELLRAVGVRLTDVVRPGDTLARVYGDEFVLLCEDLRDQSDVDRVSERIRRSFDPPFTLDGVSVSISASVGVAYAGPGDLVSGALIAEADQAMYQIKRESALGRATSDLDSLPSRGRSVALGRDLRAALTGKGLDVAYQPIVEPANGVLSAVEVLLRWTHPVEGPMPPASVIAVAERTGVVSELGAWVLERACRDWVRWQQDDPDGAFDLAVNISTVQLMAPDIAGEVGRILDRTAMVPERLVLEVTESVLVEDPERARLVLLDLKALGVRVALDDFGAGYSSLSYLNRLPIDILKIDRQHIESNGGVGRSSEVISALTTLAHALGLQVVIEGVETKIDRLTAVQVGAELAQGYFYARPVAAADLEALLRGAGASTSPFRLPRQRARSLRRR